MKKLFLLLIVLFLNSISSIAQTATDFYLQQENTRIANANATEIAISNFTTQNMNNYSLTQSKLSQVTTVTIEGVTQTLSGQQLQDAINQAKRDELRKLYFQQNPSTLAYYTANTIALNVTPCINSNFVNGTAGFYFASTTNGWNQYNNFPSQSLYPVIPSPTGIISLVNNIVDSNTVTTQFPNGLRMVCPNPTPPTGAQAIRLNNGNGGNYDTSILRRRFIVTSPTISFNYALVLQNGHQDTPQNPNNHLSQPYFQYRLVDNSLPETDPNYVLVDNHIVCDILDTRFHQGIGQALFTDWSCQVINTSQYQNKDVTLQILVSDCGQSGHYGYAYLDNFCNMNACTNSSFGDVNLNPVNINCPTFPLNITGSVSIPSGSNLSSLTLEILNSSGTVINSITNYTISGNNFTFQLNQSNFGINPNGGYRLRTKAVFTTISGGISNTVTAPLNSNFDITFNNCISANIALNPVNENCPLFPLVIAGSFSIPTGVTISNFKLEVLNSAGVVVTPNGTLYNPTISGNTFFFAVNQINFGNASPMTGNFEFRISATVTLGSSTLPITSTSANPGSDVSFIGCCYTCPPPPCCDNENISYQVLAPYSISRQANFKIQANSTIDNGAFASIHAGNHVLLKNGFVAKTGSRVHAYIEGCTGNFTLKSSNTNTKNETSPKSLVSNPDISEIELIKTNDGFHNNITILPNPNNGIFKISLNELQEETIQITDLVGLTIFKANFKDQKEIEVNIQDNPKGIYIVKVFSGDQTYTEKIIKN